VCLHAIDGLLQRRRPEDAAAEQPALEAADLPMQILQATQLVGDRDHQLADVDVRPRNRPLPLFAIPAPERRAFPAHRGQQVPARERASPRPRRQTRDREHVIDRRDQPRERLRDTGRPPPRAILDQRQRPTFLPTQLATPVVGRRRDQRRPPWRRLGDRPGRLQRRHAITSNALERTTDPTMLLTAYALEGMVFGCGTSSSPTSSKRGGTR